MLELIGSSDGFVVHSDCTCWKSLSQVVLQASHAFSEVDNATVMVDMVLWMLWWVSTNTKYFCAVIDQYQYRYQHLNPF